MNLTPNQISEQEVSRRRHIENAMNDKVWTLPESRINEIVFQEIHSIGKSMRISPMQAFYLRHAARKWVRDHWKIEGAIYDYREK